MNMPFNVLSAADPAARCRVFADANLQAQRATHWFKNLEAQTAGAPCLRHPYSKGCEACPVLADVGILGTPCHPFSLQREGRWKQGSVDAHAEFDVSMCQSLAWMHKFQPAAVIFEQVLGFGKPFHSNTTETPLARLHSCRQISEMCCRRYAFSPSGC